MKIRTLLIALMLFTLLSCADKKAADNEKPEKKKISVGVVLSVGGRGDNSFNDSAVRGADKAEKDFGVTVNIGQPARLAEDKKYLNTFAAMECDLVVGVGFLMKDSVEEIAAKYPKVKFIIIDSVSKGDNVRSIVFKEDEGSFLVGAIAALKSENAKIGFIGGMKVPLIKKFERGYNEGAKYINPDIEIFNRYIGSGGDAFHDPVKAEQIATTLFKNGADIIYHAAGQSGNGLIKAAQQEKKFAIGVDSNQNYMAPGWVLTSMVKNVDEAVYSSIEDIIKGQFTSGLHILGLKEKGVNYALDEYNKELLDSSIIKKIEDIRSKIISGEIQIVENTDK